MKCKHSLKCMLLNERPSPNYLNNKKLCPILPVFVSPEETRNECDQTCPGFEY